MSVFRPLRSPLRFQQSKPVVKSSLKELMVITGFSGAGKSTAMNVFEDAGYFCVDNLPPEMIRSLTELFMHEGSKVERAAVVSDVRGGVYFEALQAVVDELESVGLDHHVLFLEAAEQTLVNRYKETRRRHPLAPDGSVTAGVAAERALLEPLRNRADVVIDTTGMSAAMLRGKIADELVPRRAAGRLALTFMSFGFKHGPPREEDLAFDVRFLPNPHYEPELRELTGEDPRVVEYVARDGAWRNCTSGCMRCSTSCCRVHRRGSRPPRGGDRLHRRPPPLGGDRRGSRGPLPRAGWSLGGGHPPRHREALTRRIIRR